jgi:hypothetical protein
MKDKMSLGWNCDTKYLYPLGPNGYVPPENGERILSPKSSFKYKTRRWIMSRIVIVILIYYRHKPIDGINLLGS